jgi:hypothetical protein
VARAGHLHHAQHPDFALCLLSIQAEDPDLTVLNPAHFERLYPCRLLLDRLLQFLLPRRFGRRHRQAVEGRR